MPSKYTLSDLQYFAEIKNGKCLSKEYKDLYSLLEWRCQKGHRFSLAFAYVKQGAWCKPCEKKQRKFEVLQEYAEEQGGKCLSPEFVNTSTKYKWQCNKGHIWNSLFSNLKRDGWCKQCNIEKRNKEYYKKLKSFVENKGGKCLFSEYTGSTKKYPLECKFGHTWKSKASKVLFGRSWCPTCSGKIPHTLKEFQEIAKLRKGKCLSKSFVNGKTPMTWQCEKKHIWQNSGAKILKGQWCRKCWEESLSEKYRADIAVLQKFAESKGGKLISKKYINANIPVKWQCSKGHIWLARFGYVKSRSWCPYCAHRVKLTIEEMQTLASMHKGKCLSTKYIDNQTKLKWQCAKKHIWTAIPSSIKIGRWCQECGIEKRRKSVTLIEK